MKVVYLMLFSLFIFSVNCYQVSDAEKLVNSDKQKKAKPADLSFDSINTLVFKTENGWGYDIIINKKIYIHQSHIPAINELKPFKTAEDAQKVADYAIQKFKSTLKLPAITYYELDSLSVL